MLRPLSFLACVLFCAIVPACSNPGDPEDASPGCLAGNRSQCVMQLALGDRFGCARMHGHTAWCWGANDESQLGYPTTDVCPEPIANGQTQSIACHTYPFQVVGLEGVAQVYTGGKFACALLADGTVTCWGDNSVGQLGRGDTRASMRPAAVPGIANVTALSLGARHACAIAGGTVFCWGADDTLQLGIASASQLCGAVPCETLPRQVVGVGRATRVASGAGHTCALAEDGTVACWGANDYGQLGTGSASEAPQATPRTVMAGHLTKFATDVVAGDQHNCTVRDDGAVFCWGRNDHHELGSDFTGPVPDHAAGPCSPTPLLVATLPGAPAHWDIDLPIDGGPPPDMSVDAPPDLGGVTPVDMSGPDMAPLPVAPAATPPRTITARGDHACVLLSDGRLRCWGGDAEGQLGDGRRVPAGQNPVEVIAHPGAAVDNPLGGAAAVIAGNSTSCALLTDGSLRCWGSNLAGALGDGDIAPQSGPTPVVW